MIGYALMARMSANAELRTYGSSPDHEAIQRRAAVLIGIAQALARELRLRPRTGRRTALDMSLDRDWGFDSLSRAELLCGSSAPSR